MSDRDLCRYHLLGAKLERLAACAGRRDTRVDDLSPRERSEWIRLLAIAHQSHALIPVA